MNNSILVLYCLQNGYPLIVSRIFLLRNWLDLQVLYSLWLTSLLNVLVNYYLSFLVQAYLSDLNNEENWY